MKTIKDQNKKAFKEKRIKIDKKKKPSETKVFNIKMKEDDTYKEDNERLPFINEKIRIFYYLIILLLISKISKSFCHKKSQIMISRESIVTLKVSGEGQAKVFYDGICQKAQFSKQGKVYIDEEEMPVQSTYNLNPQKIVKLIWENDITECRCMFRSCSSIVELNFTSFDTSKCRNFLGMFRGCNSLTTLNLSSFDTSSATQMSDMFWDCFAINSLDVSSFDTSIVTYGMGHMFCNCRSLETLNLSNYNMPNVLYIDNMFNGCESLKILDFPNFDARNVQKIFDMFINCYNLEYINLKNFKINNNMDINFFKGTPINFVVCTENEKLINVRNNPECNIVDCTDNWNANRKRVNTKDNSCINDCTLTNYKYEYNYKCYLTCLNGTYNSNYKCYDCHQDCRECTGNYTLNNTNCISCSSPEKVLKFGNCVNKNECLRNTYYNDTSQQTICKCDLEQCFICSLDSFNKNLCTKCEEEYYTFYDYNNEHFPYFNCSKSPSGYYFDNKDSTYKLCFSSCKTCDISGNETLHNCKECKKGYNFEIHFGLYKNCYVNCSYYHYYDNEISYCTKRKECIKEFDKLIEDKKECVSNCTKDDHYKYEFRKRCYKVYPFNSTLRKNSTELEGFPLDKKYFCKPICYEEAHFEILHTQECVKNCAVKYIIDKSCILNFKNPNSEKTKEKEEDIQNKEEKEEDSTKAYDIMSENIEKGFTSEEYDTSGLENGTNDVVEFEQMTVTLTTTSNQKNDKENAKVTCIDLGECEKILRNVYNIDENEMIFMKKIDVIQEGMKIPKVESDVYNKLNGSNLIRLNLPHCSNSKADISVPTIITESLDKLNSSSGYYNDICYTATSESGTDIILNDRKTEFIEGNKTVCQDNCVFSEYDDKIKKLNVHAMLSNLLHLLQISILIKLNCMKILSILKI